jgi:hypothetical protein
VVLGISLGACADFSSLSGSTVDAAIDAYQDTTVWPDTLATSDALAEAATVDAGTLDTGTVDAGPVGCQLSNLLLNGDFEDKFVQWGVAPGGEGLASPIARSGAWAAKLCGIDNVYVAQAATFPPARYRFTGWVRASAPDPVPGQTRFYLGTDSAGPSAPLGDTWQCVENEWAPADAAATSFAIDLYKSGGDRICALVDDLALYAVPPGGVPAECKCP